jgi:subtilisin family serine protease
MKSILFLVIICFLYACKSNKLIVISNHFYNSTLSNKQEFWHYKDIIKDSISGISLDRAYQELVKNKKGNEVIVAVIDTQVDLNHKDLKESFWINKDEIPNNNIDDDNNGYVDDVNGWNFIGNKKGESLYLSRFENVRIVKEFGERFQNKTINSIPKSELNDYKEYNRALKDYEEIIKIKKRNLFHFNNWKKQFNLIKNTLENLIPSRKITIDNLNKIITKDTVVLKVITDMKNYIIKNKNDKWINNLISNENRFINYYLNLNYNDRELIGDNPNNLEDKYYGFNNVSINIDSLFNHATLISGVLVDNIKMKKIIKLMPLVVSCSGDEHDKDIALAIRYAVDNGAKIINMSSKKLFSLRQNWIQKALKYAEANDVLVVNSSGNNSFNVDINYTFPTDVDDNKDEILNNFVNVSSSSYHLDKNLISWFSNYGKKNVDLFAPGENIYTTNVNNNYKFEDGTSLSAPIVSGVAALIWSYYPKLKASEVKEILLESGVSYDIDVELPSYDEEKKLVPFSSLSKSGKIVNAYNALLYAKNYKKWKQGKWPKKK